MRPGNPRNSLSSEANCAAKDGARLIRQSSAATSLGTTMLEVHTRTRVWLSNALSDIRVLAILGCHLSQPLLGFPQNGEPGFEGKQYGDDPFLGVMSSKKMLFVWIFQLYPVG